MPTLCADDDERPTDRVRAQVEALSRRQTNLHTQLAALDGQLTTLSGQPDCSATRRWALCDGPSATRLDALIAAVYRRLDGDSTIRKKGDDEDPIEDPLLPIAPAVIVPLVTETPDISPSTPSVPDTSTESFSGGESGG